MFEVSSAKREILERLAERDWSPTDLAEELGKSRNTVYNHLEDLHGRGLLTKTQVAAKTRPKNEYSIGSGFVQYLAVLPGQYTETSLALTPKRETTLRIWSLPQAEFQPFVERYWWRIRNSTDIDYRNDVRAVAVYGSVARGEADEDSDVDFLVITETERSEERVADQFGSIRIEADDGSKIGMTEVYSIREYRDSVTHGSGFLETIRDELHVIYDPDGTFRNTENVTNDEQ